MDFFAPCRAHFTVYFNYSVLNKCFSLTAGFGYQYWQLTTDLLMQALIDMLRRLG